jgi:phage terminase small subunit
MTLSPKQQRFVDEYLVDLNGTQACIRAGYSRKGASVQACRLLALAKVQKAIQEGREAASRRTEITLDRVLKELAKIGFANMADYVDKLNDLTSLDRDLMAAVGEVIVEEVDGVKRTRVKLLDKRAALVDLGKHLGAFVTKHEVSGPAGGPVTFRRVVVDPKKAAQE